MLTSFLNISKLKNPLEVKFNLFDKKSNLDYSKISNFLKSFFKTENNEKQTNLVKLLSEEIDFKQLKKEDFFTINEIVNESALQIATVVERCNHIYSEVLESVSLRDIEKLKNCKIDFDELNTELELLKDNVYYFIKSLDTNSVEASKFYVLILSYLQDLVLSIKYIFEYSYFYINDKYQLKFNQIRDLKGIENQVQNLFGKIEIAFKSKKNENIDTILNEKTAILNSISDLIQKQIIRNRTTLTNTKSSKLYFSILLKTNDLIKSSMNLLLLFKSIHTNSNKR